jgi:ubiquilin
MAEILAIKFKMTNAVEF